ncbi:RAMP superfamily CRISPR-associated protein [Coleofasciculus sp.]|uniref:RAMP superfamily CRISPR-associated protein n=1 Tax=Coleofasciculus sp. TaxID=3100458 RepID=UPI003A278812
MSNNRHHPTPISAATMRTTARTNHPQPTVKRQRITPPLQALNHTLFIGKPTAQDALNAAVNADDTCESVYEQLTQKTKSLATETLTIEFPWRLRVGGTRGFNDLLLPVFHPVYGIPYIPASSLKGMVLAWARTDYPDQVNRLFGTLDQGIGCVQFLDAFPTRPSLSVDMANSQWHWQNHRVNYQPEPHALLSMEMPELVIGLAPTCRGNSEDVKLVKGWLEKALAVSGLGSRVSAGYGRTNLTEKQKGWLKKTYQFQLWTAGMYGAEQNSPEFRPTAVRGMLRYWFRAIALGLYPPQQCQHLEAILFGTLEPTSQSGTLRIGVDWEEEERDNDHPHLYQGKICLEAQNEKHLVLIRRILQLASHLGGIGKGSRRPLHWNQPYPGLRGCYWQLTQPQLSSSPNIWRTKFLPAVKDAFLAVEPPSGVPGNGNPGKPGGRYQDVLNHNARIYLVPCPQLKHPEDIRDWRREGIKSQVRGKALTLLYEPRFKGVNKQGEGNANVGGCLETPSYVVIKSNFPEGKTPYQTVTVFGANQSSRAAFIQALPKDSIPVWTTSS